MIKYCNLCERNVAPTKKFNWGWFLLLMLACGLGIFYVIYFLLRSPNSCPICGNKTLLPPDTMAKILAAKQAQQSGGNG